MKRVVLYTMSACPHCDIAKRFLDKHRIKYRLVNVKTPAGQKEFYKTGFRAVPIVKVGDQFINGFDVKKFNSLYKS